jgi:hypothetical protein
MTNYSAIAARLLSDVKYAELERPVDYADSEVRQATVHTRQDVVLIVSHLSSLNAQVAVVRFLLWVIAICLAMLVDHFAPNVLHF